MEPETETKKERQRQRQRDGEKETERERSADRNTETDRGTDRDTVAEVDGVRDADTDYCKTEADKEVKKNKNWRKTNSINTHHLYDNARRCPGSLRKQPTKTRRW